MSRTVFIEAALNGPWSQSRQPLMPVTTSDLITDGINCAKAGASIIHIHVYDPNTGKQFEDFDLHTEKRNLAGEVVAEDVVDEALDWWADQPEGEPAFLFLHFYDVHYAYDPPAPYSTAFDRAPKSGDPR